MDPFPFTILSSSSSPSSFLSLGNSSGGGGNNENGNDGSDPSIQASILLWNIGIGYLPLTALICYAVISHDTRSTLATLRTTYILGHRKNEAIHGALRLLIGSYILRISWMGLLSQNFANKLTGPSCYTGIDCGGQIFHSALNRFSALLYFMALCRIGPVIGSAWLDANPQNILLPGPNTVLASSSSSPKSSLFSTAVWIPPILEWDMSLLATDGFLLALQVFLIILSVALPNNLPNYSPIYEAFQFQVATLSALLSLWFLSFGIYVLKEQCSMYRSTNYSTRIRNNYKQNTKNNNNDDALSDHENFSTTSTSSSKDNDEVTYSSSSKWTWKTKLQNLTKPLSSSATGKEEDTPLLVSSSSSKSSSSSLSTLPSSPTPSSPTTPSSPSTDSPRQPRKNSTRSRHTPIYIRPDEIAEHSVWQNIVNETTVRETKVWCNRLFTNNTDNPCSCLYVLKKIPLPAYYTSLTCILIAVLYGLRCPLFLYSSFVSNSGKSWTSYLYPYFYYTIPEILPGLLLIQISMPGGIQNIRKWYDKIY